MIHKGHGPLRPSFSDYAAAILDIILQIKIVAKTAKVKSWNQMIGFLLKCKYNININVFYFITDRVD